MRGLIRIAIGVLLLAILLLATIGVARAHTSGTSFLALKATDKSTVAADWDFDLRDLDVLLDLDRDGDGAVTWGEVTEARAKITTLVQARSRLSAAGQECRARQRESFALAEHGDGVYLRLSLSFVCGSALDSLLLDHSGWFLFDPGHRALVEYQSLDGQRSQALLSVTNAQWHAVASHGSRLREFLFEGMRHLVTGYDHLAFLGVLLLALARRSTTGRGLTLGEMLRRALTLITAFTLAHSLTLALAATGIVVFPVRPIEIAIAASVLLAALLNLWRGAADHGWKLAFVFGLVHGLGFASALAELASGGIDLLALAAFNLGIEAAQIAIAAAAVPPIWWLFRDRRRERLGVPLASLSVACVAATWVAARWAN